MQDANLAITNEQLTAGLQNSRFWMTEDDALNPLKSPFRKGGGKSVLPLSKGELEGFVEQEKRRVGEAHQSI